MTALRDPAATTTRRFTHLDQLRAAAALYVAFYHAALVFWPIGGPRPPWYLYWLDFGHYGVAAFIVISGFSLALRPALEGRTSVDHYWLFMKKRALRLLPPYWVVLAGSIVLLDVASHTQVATTTTAAVGEEWVARGALPASSVIAHTLLIHDFWTVPSANSPLWSIAVEWHLYFLFPLLLWVGCKYGMRWLLAGATVAGVGLHYIVIRTDTAGGTVPQFLALFSAGIAAAYAVAARTRSSTRPRSPAWAGWAVIAASFGAFLIIDPTSEVVADLVAGGMFAIGLILVSTAAGRRQGRRSAAGRVMAGIGAFSYSLYLVHSPTEKIVYHFLVRPLGLGPVAGLGVLAVTGVGAAVAAAYVTYVLVERPSLARSKQVPA